MLEDTLPPYFKSSDSLGLDRSFNSIDSSTDVQDDDDQAFDLPSYIKYSKSFLVFNLMNPSSNLSILKANDISSMYEFQEYFIKRINAAEIHIFETEQSPTPIFTIKRNATKQISLVIHGFRECMTMMEKGPFKNKLRFKTPEQDKFTWKKEFMKDDIIMTDDNGRIWARFESISNDESVSFEMNMGLQHLQGFVIASAIAAKWWIQSK